MDKRRIGAVVVSLAVVYTILKITGVDFTPKSYKCVITKVEHTTSPYIDGAEHESTMELKETSDSAAYAEAYLMFYIARASYVRTFKEDGILLDRPKYFRVVDNNGEEVKVALSDADVESIKTSVSGSFGLDITEIEFPKY